MRLAETRGAVAEAARELFRTGLVQGTSGNVSMRDEETGLIAMTPSAVAYDTLQPGDVTIVDIDARLVEGTFAPSTELPMHTEVYRRMPWVQAVVHTHSPYATTFAALNRPIEPVHYLIAMAGECIPVAPYATYGTPEIGRSAVETFGSGLAVLLAQHGVLTIGRSLAQAMTVASVTEYVARIYHQALVVGAPVTLPQDELCRLKDKFAGYKVVPTVEEVLESSA